MVLFGVVFKRYYYNFFYGPFYKDYEDLNAIDDINSLEEYFVKVEGTDLYETGIYYAETDGNKEVVLSNYFVLLIGDKFLAVDVPKSKDLSLRFSGKLEKMPDELCDELKKIYMESEIYTEEFENVFYPFMLDAREFREPGIVGIIFCAVILLIIVINFFKVILYTLNPKTHPAYRSIRKYGDVDDVVSEINNELQMESSEKYLSTTITKSWLIVEKFNNLKIYKLADIVWVYKTVRRKWGIPVLYELSIKFYNKKSINIPFERKEEILDAAISSIFDRVPWAVYGYSIEHHKMWSRNYEDFIRMVEDNKRGGI